MYAQEVLLTKENRARLLAFTGSYFLSMQLKIEIEQIRLDEILVTSFRVSMFSFI